MAIHVGLKRAGWRGLLVAGICFILPGAVIVSLIAHAYVRYGLRPDARAMFAGIAPVIIAIVAQAAVRLSRSVVRDRAGAIVILLSFALSLSGLNELAILIGAGFAMLALRTERTLAAWLLLPAAGAATTATPVSLSSLALFFVKVGSILFGSGYVLLAFLRADLVERWHWLSDRQLIDAIAVGQMTPGPVLTTATFVGYLLAGWRGAAVATVAIFLPAFVFVALAQPLIPRLRGSRQLATFLDGVVAASLGLMAAVTVTLGIEALRDPVWIAESAVALLVLVQWNVNSAWLVLAGAVVGLLRGIR